MNLLNFLILLSLSAGHVELMVTLINRAHSLRIGRPALRLFRRVENAIIVLVPLLMFWTLGIRGRGLLVGGSWSQVPAYWLGYLSLCAAGLAGLAWSVARWRLKPIPSLQLANHSRTVDVAEKLGFRPLGQGPFRLMASIPGNEIFRIQVSDKRYCLPRLPAAWDGLSILHLADTHFLGTVDRPFFEEVARMAEEMSPDVVVFTGDLLDDLKYLRWLPETIGRLKAPLGCYYILGNHDWWLGTAPIREAFRQSGWEDVAGRVATREHRGHKLEIGGTERPWMGTHPDFANRGDCFRLLLSHTPDHFAWARRHGVDLMLAGHNHGGQVVLPVVGPVFAPSRYGVRFASGSFWSDPTLLCVSRGLSGRHPLRLNCLPELTQVVLVSPAAQSPQGTRPWVGG